MIPALEQIVMIAVTTGIMALAVITALATEWSVQLMALVCVQIITLGKTAMVSLWICHCYLCWCMEMVDRGIALSRLLYSIPLVCKTGKVILQIKNLSIYLSIRRTTSQQYV